MHTNHGNLESMPDEEGGHCWVQVSYRSVIDLTISALRKELVENLPYNIASMYERCELTFGIHWIYMKLCVCIVYH